MSLVDWVGRGASSNIQRGANRCSCRRFEDKGPPADETMTIAGEDDSWAPFRGE